MNLQSVFVAIVACLLWPSVGRPQSTTATCGSWFEPRTLQDAKFAEADQRYNRPPVIFGARYGVPPMRIRLIDGKSGSPLKNKGITINYSWRWLEYPYPEHAWGAWSDAADQVKCELDHDGWFDAPPHEVQPRGWYDGKYTHFPWPRRPEFTGINMVAVTGYFARVNIAPHDLKKFETLDLVVRVFDGWRTEIVWQPKGQ